MGASGLASVPLPVSSMILKMRPRERMPFIPPRLVIWPLMSASIFRFSFFARG